MYIEWYREKTGLSVHATLCSSDVWNVVSKINVYADKGNNKRRSDAERLRGVGEGGEVYGR